MSQASVEIKAINDNEFQVVKVNGDGKVKDAQVYRAIEAPDGKTIGKILVESDRKDSTYRAGYQAFLGRIFVHQRLDGFRGKGDPTTGKTPKELKAAVRDAETAVVEEMIKVGEIKLGKAEDMQVAMQEFLSRLRENKNYSNIKTHCTGYFAFCGKNPVTGSGRLVPAPVMMEEVKAAINRTPADKTLTGQIMEVATKLSKTKISHEDAESALAAVTAMQTQLKNIVADYNEALTDAHAAGQAAVKGAMQRAPAPAREPALV